MFGRGARKASFRYSFIYEICFASVNVSILLSIKTCTLLNVFVSFRYRITSISKGLLSKTFKIIRIFVRWETVRFCVVNSRWAILLCSETKDELSSSVRKPKMSYPSVKGNLRWVILLCSETEHELSFCVMKLNMSYPSVLWNCEWAVLVCVKQQMIYPFLKWNFRWAILLCNETADELLFYVLFFCELTETAE